MQNNTLFSIFSDFPELFILMSSRKDGNMKIPYLEESESKVKKNREKYFIKHGLSEKDIVSAGLVHGGNIEVVNKGHAGKTIADTDGLITSSRGIYLSITVADCLPVILYHPGKKVMVLLHCGWKGLAAGIIGNAGKKLKEDFNIKADEIYASIGPGIGQCHFEGGKELLEKLDSFPELICKKGNRNFFNLKQLAQMQLEAYGIKQNRIQVSSICTFCSSDIYFSHRKDKIYPVQAMMVIAGIRKKTIL